MSETIIKIYNLTKIFQADKVDVLALKDINIDIKKGEIFGIIGLSGAGKSTLVRMMNLLEKPTEGKVFFEDKNLESLSDAELRMVRKEIGMIFQNFNLLEQSNVLKNIMFPLEISGVEKSERLKRAKELLSLVDLSEKEKSYPSQLSGGQKQRVAIARALATNPKVLLCDEATSALDPKTTNQILELLKKINRELNVTVVIITHQMFVIESVCDRVAIIDQSRIAEIGTVDEVFKNPKSDIGKKLIFGSYVENIKDLNIKTEGQKIRLIFDGTSTNEPVISNMVLESSSVCNILFANTKLVEEKAVGEMIIELPKDINKANQMKDYLNNHNITFWEVE